MIMQLHFVLHIITQFGHKPELYDFIRKMRGEWYSYCEKFLPDAEKLKEIYSKFERKMQEGIKKIKEIDKRVCNLEQKEKDKHRMFIVAADDLISDVESAKSLAEEEPTPEGIATASAIMSGATDVASGIIPYININNPFFGEKKCPRCGRALEMATNISAPYTWACKHCGYEMI